MMKNNLFIIEWFGPFKDEESLITWENENNKEHNFYFYFISGIPFMKKNVRSYCGITQNQDGYVYCRFQHDTTHPIHDFRDNKEIWIGRFGDHKRHQREDIELCETMIISYAQPELNTRKKAYYPNENVVIINRWFNTAFEPRLRRIYIAQEMPDLLILDEVGVWGTEKIKKLRDFT